MISCSYYIICLRLFSKITTKLHKYSLETPSPGTKPRTAVNLLGMSNFSSMSKYESVHQEELSFKKRPDTYRRRPGLPGLRLGKMYIPFLPPAQMGPSECSLAGANLRGRSRGLSEWVCDAEAGVEMLGIRTLEEKGLAEN